MDPSKQAPLAFSMEELKWHRRPLLLFAAGMEGRAMMDQLERVEAAREGMRDRDMTLTVIRGDAGGMHEGEAISMDAAERLRERFSVPAEDFAVILVGKDGGEKLRRSEPVSMQTLFDLIDSMPMRQGEMAADEDQGA